MQLGDFVRRLAVEQHKHSNHGVCGVVALAIDALWNICRRLSSHTAGGKRREHRPAPPRRFARPRLQEPPRKDFSRFLGAAKPNFTQADLEDLCTMRSYRRIPCAERESNTPTWCGMLLGSCWQSCKCRALCEDCGPRLRGWRPAICGALCSGAAFWPIMVTTHHTAGRAHAASLSTPSPASSAACACGPADRR